jgi:hypothetical protein
MAVADVIDGEVWIRRYPAQKRTGLSERNLLTLALAGRIRTLTLPGVGIRFCVDDLDQVVSELQVTPKQQPAAAAK